MNISAWFTALDLRKKLELVITSTLVLALMITTGLYTVYDIQVQKRSQLERTESIADVFAKRSSAAVTFMDEARANETLESLSIISNIRFACLFSFIIDEPLGSVQFEDGKFECLTSREQDPFINDVKGGQLVYRPIMVNNQIMGSLTLYTHNRELNDRITQILLSIFVSGMLACILAFILTTRLQFKIIEPIVDLSRTANRFSRERDWSLRAHKTTDDELGTLVDSFNNMLGRLEEDQKLLEELAYYDSLTSLPNRRKFKETLAKSFVHSRQTGTPIGLIFVDLDNFKHINDTLGHDVGDEFLKTIGKRLKSTVGELGEVARLGGDEFTVTLDGYNSVDQIEQLAKDLLVSMGAKYDLEGVEYHPSASLGIATGNALTDTFYSLMKKADIAVYVSKNEGKNTYHFYTEEKDKSLREDHQH